MTQIHATCVAREDAHQGAGSLSGVLLQGPSGSGKSDLAFRLIRRGWHLVADDRVDLVALDGRLMARGPKVLQGRMEVRGVGLHRFPFKDHASVTLICNLVDQVAVERLPEARDAVLEGIAIPMLHFYPFEASALDKLELALDAAEKGTLFDNDR